MSRVARVVSRGLLIGALWTGLGGAVSAAAEPYAVGSTVAPLSLPDQHGVTHAVDAATRGILLSRDMDGGGFVREALASDGEAKLTRAGAVYIADVQAMPGVIRRMFAIPRMRQRRYPVLLDTEGVATVRFPTQPGKASWLRLEALRVVEIRFLESADEVNAALAPPAPPAPAAPPGLPPGD